uniref:Uncharacterized protein n=1 Tax=Accipiter nisus TaxID=211598 RepID=A0A8B9M8W0_9AVES
SPSLCPLPTTSPPLPHPDSHPSSGLAVPRPKALPHSGQTCRFSGLPCVWARWCRLRWELRPKHLPQWGRSPVCTRRCRSRWELTANARPHSPQRKGFSPVWELQAKARPHSAHWKGFSPVWMRLCRSRWELQGFPPRWLFWCRSRAPGSAKLRPHWGQRLGFSPPGAWVRWWVSKEELTLKRRPQSGQA